MQLEGWSEEKWSHLEKRWKDWLIDLMCPLTTCWGEPIGQIALRKKVIKFLEIHRFVNFRLYLCDNGSVGAYAFALPLFFRPLFLLHAEGAVAEPPLPLLCAICRRSNTTPLFGA